MKFLITLIVAAILLIEARTALAGGLTINSSSETIFLMDSGDGAAALLETPPPHFGPTLISENPCLEFIGCADLEDLEDLQFRDSSALALLNLDASSDAVWRPVRAEAALGVTSGWRKGSGFVRFLPPLSPSHSLARANADEGPIQDEVTRFLSLGFEAQYPNRHTNEMSSFALLCAFASLRPCVQPCLE